MHVLKRRKTRSPSPKRAMKQSEFPTFFLPVTPNSNHFAGLKVCQMNSRILFAFKVIGKGPHSWANEKGMKKKESFKHNFVIFPFGVYFAHDLG